MIATRPQEVVYGGPLPPPVAISRGYSSRAEAPTDQPDRPGEREELSGAMSIPGIALPAGFRVGAWIDVGGYHLGRHMAAHVSAMHAMGLNDCCVMINGNTSSSFGFGSVSESVLDRLAPMLRSGGIDLTLTSWLRPDRGFIDAMLRSLPDVARRLRARAIEFDVEEAWTRVAPRGFRTHEEAANYVWDAMDSLRGMGIEVGATTQVDPLTSSRLAPVARRAHFVVPQAYSTSGHAVGTPYGPGGLQGRAVTRLRSARAVSGPLPMIMGLAAYGRGHWSPRSARDILTHELAETIRLAPAAGIQGVRYWSWKWIAGTDAAGAGVASRTPYALPFLNDIH